jgi:hypothetical protein
MSFNVAWHVECFSVEVCFDENKYLFTSFIAYLCNFIRDVHLLLLD